MLASNTRWEAMRRAIILTALPVEFQAVRAHLCDCQEDVHPQGTVYERGRFQGMHGEWEVIVAEVGEGNERSAMEVERAIRFFDPEVVLFVGVAGGLKDVSIGEVVFAPKVYGYESGKEAPEFEPRPDVGESSYPLEQRARAVARSSAWLQRILPSPPSGEVRARPGPIAAGAKVIANTGSAEYQRIRKQYGDALAVEKEGRGFLVAVRANRGVEALVIRGISDLIDGKAAADASGSQELASRHASAFAFEVLSTFRLPLVRNMQQRETKQAASESVFAVPYLRNPNFTGRVSLLQRIRSSLLSTSASPARVSLHGLGGVGKTQLTAEYAFRHIEGPEGYTHVLWARADGPSVLAASYAALADALKLPEKTSSELAVKQEAVRRWLQQNEGWLLVFDNAEQPADLQPYLPVRGRGHILITSRNPTWSELAVPLAVDVLDRPESVAFLLNRTGQTDEAAAHALAEALGDLPLALAQAAAYIEQTQTSLTDYRFLLEQRRQELLSRPGAPLGYLHTVTATWELSFEQVRTQSPVGAALLSLCAFLAPSPLPLSLLSESAKTLPEPLASAVADEVILNDAIGALRRYSLVQVAHRQLLFHRLVQAVMRDRLGEERSRWAEVALYLSRVVFEFVVGDLQSWTRCADRLPHVLAACENGRSLGVSHESTPSLLLNLSDFLVTQAEYAQARNMLAWGLELIRRCFEPGSSLEVQFLAWMGKASVDLGEYAKAQEYLERALGFIRASPEQKDLAEDAARVYSALAFFFLHKGELRQAREHAERAVALEDAEGASSGGSYADLLGNILLRQARFTEARDLFEKDLREAEAVMAPEHPSIAAARINLAMALERLGQYRQAAELFERQLVTLEAAYGSNHPQVATLLKSLGGACQNLGNLAKARECCERALHIDEARFGPIHMEVAIDLNNLARVLHELGDLRAARRDFERAIAIEEQLFGRDYSELAIPLDNLGRVLAELGEHELARTHFERALVLHERELGPEHPNVGNVCNNLGMFLASRGKLIEARPYLERALAIDERAYGPVHPEVATDLGNLAQVLLLLGVRERGVPLLERALAIRRAQDPQPDNHLAQILLNLGKAALDVSDLPTAKAWLEQALQFQERFQPDGDEAVVIRLKLGQTLYLLGEEAKAIPILEKARMLAGERLERLSASARLDLLLSLGGSQRAAGDRHEARALLEDARLLAEQSGATTRSCLVTFELAQLAQMEERPDEARRLFERVLQLGEAKEYGGTRMGAHRELGLLLEEQGDLPGARRHLSEALELGEQILGPDSSGVANLAMLLGRVLLQQGQVSLARQYLERSLAICQQLGDSNPVAQRVILPLLGRACGQTGDMARSVECARQYLALTKAATPPDQRELCDAHIVLGALLQAVGQLKEAQAELEEALRSAEQLLGEEPSLSVRMRIRLAQFHSENGAPEVARMYLTQALRSAESLLGPRDRHVAEASLHLGRLLSNEDDLAEARACFERAAEILETDANSEPLTLAAVFHELARLLLRQGDGEQALERLSRAELLCREEPQASGLLLQVLMTRGETHLKRSQFREAREDFERALHHEDFSQLTPERRGRLYNDLGVSLIRLEQPDAAFAHLEQSLTLLAQYLGKEHPGCASALFNLGTALEKSGQPLKALERYKRALEILRKKAPAHPLVEKLRARLDELEPPSC